MTEIPDTIADGAQGVLAMVNRHRARINLPPVAHVIMPGAIEGRRAA